MTDESRDADLWDRAFELFHEVLERSPEQRDNWIISAAAGDQKLLAEVQSLLRAHDDPAGPLDTSKQLDSILEFEAGPNPGDQIGPYLLTRQLGEGGMGVVFAAQQQEPLVRQVALKLIKAGMDTREVLARFERERHSLSLMEHPNIARVLDAGATTAGRPYFVMELVDGAPITRWCDERRLTTRERLELLIPVCRAVQHAHLKGVLHRDLKPSNILVAEFEGRPIPKVIDFGVAKAVADEQVSGMGLTALGRVIGTPEYMSPEQYDPRGNLDTRSDIYSLGVVLYELLAGVLPFPTERLRQANEQETQRILREEDPRTPSTRISKRDTDATAIAARRRTDPVSLRRQLRGELDWIVMKALEKDPARRYQTASELAADLERSLNDQPVSAGPPSRVYRAQVFMRRNRFAVGLLVAAFLVLAGVAVMAQVQAQRVQRLLEETERQRARASTELERAEQVSSFLTELFAVQDTVAQRGETVTARQLLDERAARVRREYADKPELRADLLETLAGAYRNLELLDTAESQLQETLDIRRAQFGDDHLQTARSWLALGSLHLQRGQVRQAEPLLRRAHSIRLRALGERHPDTLEATLRLATNARLAGDLLLAETLLRAALMPGPAETAGAASQLTAGLRSELGTVLLRQGRFADAEAVFQTALQAPDGAAETVVRGNLLNAYGAMLLERHDYSRAESLLREALALRQRIQGPRNSRALSTLSNLALLLHQTGRLAEAVKLYREVLERRREIYGPRDRNVASALHNLALAEFDLEHVEQSELLVREALSIQTEAVGPKHPDVAFHLTLLGGILRTRGELPASETALREAIAIRRAALPAQHPDLAASLVSLTRLLLDAHRLGEAAQAAEEAVTIRRAALKQGDQRITEAEELLAAARATPRRPPGSD